MSGRQRHIDGVVVAGLTELAAGALTGWLMALSVNSPEDLEKIGSVPGPVCASGTST